MIYSGKSAVQAGGVFAKAVRFTCKPRGHSNTSTSSTPAIRYTYNAAGDVVYDQDKGLTYSYNALGLVSQVLRADGTGLQYRYAADGTLITSTETQAAAGGGVAVSSRVFYLAGDRHDAMSGETYVHTPFGATLLDAGLSAKHVGFHADHLRVNGVEGPRSRVVILAYSDLNSDGFVDPSTEILEENRYYPSVWTGVGAPAQASKLPVYTRQSTALPFAYNGSRAGPLHPIRSQEQNCFGLYLTTYRTMAPATQWGRGPAGEPFWGQTDPKPEWDYASSPYSSMQGNPISRADPDGDYAHLIIGSIVGAVSGYQIGKAQGATGWKLFGYTAAGAGIGAATAGIGNTVAAGLGTVVPGQFGGAIATVGASTVSSAVSGGAYSALAGQNIGEGIWKGAASGAVGGLIQGAVGGGWGAALGGAASGALSAHLYDRPVGPAALAGAAFSLASYEINTSIGYAQYRNSGKNFLTRSQYGSVSRAAQRSFFWGKEYGGWFLSDGGVEMWPRGTKDAINPTPMPNNAVGEFHTHPSTGSFFGRSYYPDHSPADIRGFAGLGRSFVVERNNVYGLNNSEKSQVMFSTRRFNPYPFGIFLGRY